MPETILLTGATGFLGSHLLEALLDRGYKAVILKRSYSDTWRINHLMDRVKSYDLDKDAMEREHYSFVKDQNFGCVQGRIQVILSSKKGGWTNGSAIGYSQTKDWRCRA